MLRRITSLWAALFRSSTLDADMDDEMRFHVDMHAERLMRERGLSPEEARRQAFVAFGGVEKYREAGRDTRGTRWLDAIRQDTRLAGRMLLKYPALTIIGGFAMAIAIALGALTFEGVTETLGTSLPGIGDRLVAIQLATETQGAAERRVLRDFAEWRESLTTIQHLGAFRDVSHNLNADERDPEVITVAEITASAFAIASTPPMLGRTLQPQDESIGAPPVMVIGWDAWRTRFAADPAIVGRTVSLGSVAHTIVGVMPEGFKFPVSHDYWTPLRFRSAQYERLQGPEVSVFGKLAPGATLAQAKSEMSTIGQRMAAEYPQLYQRLQLVALPYTREHVEVDRPAIEVLLRTVRLLMSSLLVLVAANLAILMYARTVTRLGEIAVRSALGASRTRLLVQLFIEALALSLIGAVAGLAIAKITMDVGIAPMIAAGNDLFPYWIALELSPSTIAYALVLAVVAALIVGVLPGLRSTGKQTHSNLRTSTGGTSRPLGALWTTLIVVQVAIAAVILPVAIWLVGGALRMEFERPGFAADQYVLAKVDDAAKQAELIARLAQQPDIQQVSFSFGVPGFEGPRYFRFDGDGAGDPLDANALDVAVDFIDIFDATILAGRDFVNGDAGSTNVIVNRTFAERLSSDRSVLGRQFRFVRRDQAANTPDLIYQIVGVVDDFPKVPPLPGTEGRETIYRPIGPGRDRSTLMIRYRGPITANAVGQLRRVAAEVAPSAPLRDVRTLGEFYRLNREPFRLLSLGVTLVTASVLLLSAAGVYALMSFTMAQRTREIGIRAALGADPRRLLAGIFGRVFVQISIGLAIGLLLSGGVLWTTLPWQQAAQVSAIVAAVIFMVGLGAAIGPARRGLRIEPTEALRIDG